MRYLIITDIHGGIDNLTKVLKNEKFDKLLYELREVKSFEKVY